MLYLEKIVYTKSQQGLQEKAVYEITSQEEDNMNILVCVKQVPDTTQIKIDPVNRSSHNGTAAGSRSPEGVRRYRG